MFLNSEKFAEPCRGSNEDELVESRLQGSPLLRYASHYWPYLSQKLYSTNLEIRKSILSFIRNPSKLAACIQVALYTSTGWDLVKEASSLHVAAFFGLNPLLDDILTQELPVDSQDPIYGHTPLMYACKRGHIATVKKLLEQGASINLISAQNSNALFEAILAAQTKVVEVLVNVDTLDINTTHLEYCKSTPLIMAVRRRLYDIMMLLMRRPELLLNERDAYQRTALHHAAMMTDSSYSEALITSQDIDINCADDTLEIPLLLAAGRGLDDNVEVLLRGGANPYARASFGYIALHRAVGFGHISIVKLMINHKVDIHVMDSSHRTLLHTAGVNDKAEIAELLLDAGVEINARGNRGEPCLHDVARWDRREICKLLLERGADTTIKDNVGRTPRIVAAQNGNSDIVTILKNAVLDERSAEALEDEAELELPLWALAKIGLTTQVKTYIENGYELDSRDPDSNNSALHEAALYGHHDILVSLLEAGMSHDDPDQCGQAPLHLTASNGHERCAKALIAAGADLNAKDMWGQTALDIAQNRSQWRVAILLAGHGAIIDARVKSIRLLFFASVEKGNLQAVKRLLAEEEDVQALNQSGFEALQLAKTHGHHDIVFILRQYRLIYTPPSI